MGLLMVRRELLTWWSAPASGLKSNICWCLLFWNTDVEKTMFCYQVLLSKLWCWLAERLQMPTSFSTGVVWHFFKIPFSNNCTTGKFVQITINGQVMGYVESNNLISDIQDGCFQNQLSDKFIVYIAKKWCRGVQRKRCSRYCLIIWQMWRSVLVPICPHLVSITISFDLYGLQKWCHC